MNLVVVIAGIAGLAISGYGVVDFALAGHRHRWLGIIWALLVASATVWVLLTWGDRLLQ